MPAAPFRRQWSNSVSNKAGLQCIDVYLNKTHRSHLCELIQLKIL